LFRYCVLYAPLPICFLMFRRPPRSTLFPTRRSSDLSELLGIKNIYSIIKSLVAKEAILLFEEIKEKYKPKTEKRVRLAKEFTDRSEEHTSELQSRENLVCRLLLEKKKNKQDVDTRK